MSTLKNILLGISFTATIFTAPLVQAKKLDERPSPITMVADAVMVRPVLLGATILGAGLYVVTLPITLIGGNSEEAGRNFVITPFKATFVRCLGCTRKHLDDPDDYYSK